MQKRFHDILFARVDNAPLVVFRILFGFLLMAEAWGAILTGWVERAFIEPQHNFPFMLFSWLEPLPGNGMYYYYFLMGLAGLFVMIGYYYRTSMGFYAIMWAVVYFMQKTNYNNHYYLLMLLNFLMVLVPANGYASLDARRNPLVKNLTCPRWCLLLFAAQVSIVYVYASVAKMYPDWVAAKPIHIWFENKKDYFLIGPLLAKEWFQHTVAWGGIIFDLLIAPGLMWKRTRKVAFIASIFFHLFNSAVFQVGIFPYMAIAFALFFFPPDSIRKIFLPRKPKAILSPVPVSWKRSNLALMSILAIYLCFQLLLPLRHWLYPGNVNWTEEGHRLSWHMMLRVKSGYVRLSVHDLAGDSTFQVNHDHYLTPKQARAVATRPDMMYQYIQLLENELMQQGYDSVAIYANSMVSLNGRPTQPLYDPAVDLTKVDWHPFRHSDWLVPLMEDESESGVKPIISSRNLNVSSLTDSRSSETR